MYKGRGFWAEDRHPLFSSSLLLLSTSCLPPAAAHWPPISTTALVSPLVNHPLALSLSTSRSSARRRKVNEGRTGASRHPTQLRPDPSAAVVAGIWAHGGVRPGQRSRYLLQGGYNALAIICIPPSVSSVYDAHATDALNRWVLLVDMGNGSVADRAPGVVLYAMRSAGTYSL